MNEHIPPSNEPDSGLARSLRQRLVAVEGALAIEQEHRTEIEVKIGALTTEATHIRALLQHYSPGSTAPENLSAKTSIPDSVVQLLAEIKKPLHYREIETALRERGISTGQGKDPANAILATYFNDKRLIRVRRGTYALAGSATKAPAARTKTPRR